MRDLAKYPVTSQEIVECLLSMASQTDAEQAAGDMRPTLLHTAAVIITACPQSVKDKVLKDIGLIDTVAKKFADGLTLKSSK